MADFFDLTDIAQGITHQADHCRHNAAPATAAVVAAQLAVLESDTALGAAMRSWPGRVLEDAMPLRIAGGLHHLHLTGKDDRLLPVYRGEVADQAMVDALVLAVVADHDVALVPWLDSPPQTNEAGRSASFMAGLLWLSAHGIGPRFELNELGASAGINTMMDRYFYDLSGVTAGPPDSPMQIVPEWRGPPPPQADVIIDSIRGCDQLPINLADPQAAMRVKSYVWPEMPERLARMDAAIALANQRAPDVASMDAADWTVQRLAEPHAPGVARVFHHSIVWQYIPELGRDRISAAIAAAGAAATPDRPLAWIMLETNRATFKHELTVRRWSGRADDGQPHLLAEAHAHGVWVEWLAG